jgi:hypothetical protein
VEEELLGVVDEFPESAAFSTLIFPRASSSTATTSSDCPS